MAEIISIEKRGQFVVFELNDGSCVQFDLKNQQTIGKKGAPVKGLSSQLKGIMLDDVRDKFTDKGYFEFLQMMVNVRSYPSYSLAGVLSRAPEYEYLEGYCKLGIRADPNIGIPVNHLPKSLIQYVKESQNASSYLQRDTVRCWMANEGLFQSVLSQKNDLNAHIVNRIIGDILGERRYGGSAYGRYHDLIDVYRYDPAALTRYLVSMHMYEGLLISDAARLLRDYAMMQNIMSGGEHSYDKYPRHLMTVHHITNRNYQRLTRSFDEEKFKKTYDGSLETTVDNYVFICPKQAKQIKDEAVQQQHCVAAYIDSVLEGKCHIIFMRDRANPHQSLITLEVVNGSVVQAKGNHNRDTTPEEDMVIRKYERRLRQRKAA